MFFFAAPLSPHKESFILVNSTFATLLFGAWTGGGCPILHFSVHRRQQGQWDAVAERVDALQPQMDVRHLAPNREYVLRVSAHSEAGTTEAEYRFVTLNVTLTGKRAQPPPLSTPLQKVGGLRLRKLEGFRFWTSLRTRPVYAELVLSSVDPKDLALVEGSDQVFGVVQIVSLPFRRMSK